MGVQYRGCERALRSYIPFGFKPFYENEMAVDQLYSSVDLGFDTSIAWQSAEGCELGGSS